MAICPNCNKDGLIFETKKDGNKIGKHLRGAGGCGFYGNYGRDKSKTQAPQPEEGKAGAKAEEPTTEPAPTASGVIEQPAGPEPSVQQPKRRFRFGLPSRD